MVVSLYWRSPKIWLEGLDQGVRRVSLFQSDSARMVIRAVDLNDKISGSPFVNPALAHASFSLSEGDQRAV